MWGQEEKSKLEGMWLNEMAACLEERLPLDLSGALGNYEVEVSPCTALYFFPIFELIVAQLQKELWRRGVRIA